MSLDLMYILVWFEFTDGGNGAVFEFCRKLAEHMGAQVKALVIVGDDDTSEHDYHPLSYLDRCMSMQEDDDKREPLFSFSNKFVNCDGTIFNRFVGETPSRSSTAPKSVV